MRYLLIPGNNSLSHVAKCLEIRKILINRGKGHEVLIAVSKKHSQFLLEFDVDHYVLDDIQESDGAPSLTTAWFKQPQRIIDCINAEVALMKKYKPDRVLGIFRFTSKASAQLAGIQYDSLICGCMLPESEEVLGYSENEIGIELQKENLKGFFQYAGAKTSIAMSSLGLGKIKDIRYMLKGDRTFLWDFPEFLPIKLDTNSTHVGPILSRQWPYNPIDIEWLYNRENPLAVITFGTCTISLPVAQRIVKVLLDIGHDVVVAAGGQAEMSSIMPRNSRIMYYNFVPLQKILPHISLLICHGGQMTVFEALYHKIPVVVMPFQPEQAHTGVCLERLGCGTRLIPPQPFRQNPRVYTEALKRMSDKEIKSKIRLCTDAPKTGERLAAVRRLLGGYNGAETVARLLVEA